MNTGSVKAQEKIVVNWSGKTTGTDSDHKLTMFVQNINTGKWKAIGEEKSGKITGKFVAKDYVKDDKATVAVQVIAKDGNPEIEQSEVTKLLTRRHGMEQENLKIMILHLHGKQTHRYMQKVFHIIIKT